tara:strand:- start:1886 stop:2920 length:1035 start_codon:yes stop_codon:yes gene_type:complete
MIRSLIRLAEKGVLPDFLIRFGIRKLSKVRLDRAKYSTKEEVAKRHQDWVSSLKKSPIALVPEKANEQHYEVPPLFFKYCLGPNLKYSSGYWPDHISTLEESELAMLELSCERAKIEDGNTILELGCGWGSLTCFMAKKYTNSQITAVSNSIDQRKYILERCTKNNIKNVKVITADMNDFEIQDKFDNVISIEMFEHMRNYKKLLSKISNFLNEKGSLFIHIFSHEFLTYPFENEGDGDWMAREFFSGGMMPSHNLLLYFQDDLKIDQVWRLSGTHYEKTSLAWLNEMDKNKRYIIEIFKETYGEKNARIWFQRWRIFYLSCEQLFGYNNGTEWGVSHYRFVKN